MSKADVVNKLTRTFHGVSFQLKKHSPEILVVAGVIGVVTSAVMACKATTKVSAIVEKSKNDIDLIHKSLEHPEMYEEEYTVEDSKKDLAIVYVQTGAKLIKLYAPAVMLGAASITSILVSNNMLHKRNAAMAAAYATLSTGFKDYRGRVVERFGKGLDRELLYNLKAKEIEEVIVDEKGKEKTVKRTVMAVDPNTHSVYARFFDEYSPNWEKDSEYNLMFLKHQQAHANDLLRSRGYLFLNEVYDMLGIPRTKAGQVVGWIYNEKNPVGDNFVDFGIYEAHDFVNGYERSILIDPNVDGYILDHI